MTTKRQDFSFNLPEHLIAQQPTESRTGSRLLWVNPNKNQCQDYQFTDFLQFLKPDDLLVFNDTRVMPARLFGHKSTGGKIEILIERILDKQHALAQIRARRAPTPQMVLQLEQGVTATVIQRIEKFFELQFHEDNRSIEEILLAIGHIPLPPYIKRSDSPNDNERYQTVYARQLGAVAAPTAGLHFDQALLDKIKLLGIQTAFVTLHVGAGTFTPVKVDDLSQHIMHAEYLVVSEEVCQQIQKTKAQGGRVIAIGTTSVRALETAAHQGVIQPYIGDTRLFITPGYSFKVVDVLFTNFHLPESTLLMLVCAFGGYTQVMAAYQQAIQQHYRFFSYGDAMLIEKYQIR